MQHSPFEVPLFRNLVPVVIPVLFVFSGAIRIGAVVGRPKTTKDGLPVTDEFGDPVWEENYWATWLLNWHSNVLFIVATLLLLLMIAMSFKNSTST